MQYIYIYKKCIGNEWFNNSPSQDYTHPDDQTTLLQFSYPQNLKKVGSTPFL